MIPELGRSPGRGNGNPLQCSCLKNSIDKGAWWSTVHGGPKELDTTELALNLFWKKKKKIKCFLLSKGVVERDLLKISSSEWGNSFL